MVLIVITLLVTQVQGATISWHVPPLWMFVAGGCLGAAFVTCALILTPKLGAAATIPGIPDGYRSVFALYTIRVADRDRVRARLDEKGIGSGLFYRLALHQHPAFRAFDGRSLPASEMLANEVLSLPIHPDIRYDEVERVIADVLEAVGA